MMDAKELRHLEELAAQGEQVEHARRVLPQIRHQQQLEARRQAAEQRAAELEEVVNQKLGEFEQKRHQAQIRILALIAQVKDWVEEVKKLDESLIKNVNPDIDSLLEARTIAQNPELPDSFGSWESARREFYRRRSTRPTWLGEHERWKPTYINEPAQADNLFYRLLRYVVVNEAKYGLDSSNPPQPAKNSYVGPNGREVVETDWH